MKLSRKISLIFTLSILATFTCIAWYTYDRSIALLEQDSELKAKQTSEIAANALQQRLFDIERTNDMLAKVITEKIAAGTELYQITSVISSVIENNPSYQSISVVDNTRAQTELFKVERHNQTQRLRTTINSNTSLGHVQIFAIANQRSNDKIFVSPVTSHYDRLSHPSLSPYVFIIYPMSISSRNDCSLVVTIDIKKLMLDATSIMDEPSMYIIANTQGDYLLHPNEGKQFGFTRGKVERVQIDHPQAARTVSEKIPSFFKTTTNTSSDPNVYAYFLSAEFALHNTVKHYIFGQYRYESIADLWMSNALEGYAITVLMLLTTALVLSYSLFKLITQPLSQIAQFANRITLGEKTTCYKYENRDEIGDLANALDYLQQKLNLKYTQLKQSEEKFQRLARTDHLTGLSNRHSFTETLQQEIEQHQVNQMYMALMFIDVNNFKQVNDHLGHHNGDLLLKSIANTLASSLRSSDVVCRYGGDEFVVLITNLASLDAVHSICEKLHNSVAQLNDELDLPNFIASLSIGVAIYPSNALNAEKLMRLADKAMYSAKKKGGPQTCWSRSEH